jgi:hypothetical protein
MRTPKLTILAILSTIPFTSAFAQPTNPQPDWSYAQQIEARCEALRYHDGQQDRSEPYWYTSTVYRFVDITREGGQWCVDTSSREFNSGYAQYSEDSNAMKKALDDHAKLCHRQARLRASGQQAQQCQQRQQWFPALEQSAQGAYACASSFQQLLGRIFPEEDKCHLFKVGAKNPYRSK